MMLLFGKERRSTYFEIFGEYMFGRIRRDGFGEEEASWYYGGARYASPLELGATTRDIDV